MTAQARAATEETAGLLSLEEAQARMLAGLDPLPAEDVPLVEALGRVLAAPVASRLTLPPWDNSAMDGFALRAADVAGASHDEPVRLRVIGESAAGHPARVEVQPGTAVRILTGAPLPAAADAVVPVEETDGDDAGPAADEVLVYRQPVPGAHIRRAGSDLRAGYPLIAPGALLDSSALAASAAGGHAQVSVHRRPRLAVLATGDELVPAGAQPGEAQIPDSNSVGLLAQAVEAGAAIEALGIATDRLEDVLGRLRAALATVDVVVVSGGVSVGRHDVVKEAFEGLGRLELWRVAVQPGKPLAFGRAASGVGGDGDGGREVLLFGLPGNPVSSFVTFELFVRPVLRRLAGHVDLAGRLVVRARLTEPVTKAAGRRAFLRVRLERTDDDEQWLARLAGGQGSHVLSALAAADGLAIVPEDRQTLEEGASVEVIVLRQLGER
ncbi:MAG TPA: gephyrin-like molybdotransferase Glp [Candidatus Limnocylindria bacterium]|nr:gephyrin-like molybdotransferase Glp [Candidatus Limnocylindria bacterium]